MPLLPPLLPSWRLATTLPRLLTGIRVSSGSIRISAAWQQTPGIRLCSSKVPQKTAEQEQPTQSTETSPAIAEAKPAEVDTFTGPSLAEMSRDVSYRPDNLDKWILVHYKYYPDAASVPEYVSQGQMNQAKSWARIKTANVMIATTIGMCLLTVIWAKSLARENSLVEENFRRHMKFKRGDEDGSQSSRMGLLTNTKKDLEGEEK